MIINIRNINNKTFQRQSTAEGIEAPDGKNVGKSWTRVWSPGRRVYPCIWLVHYFIIDWVLGPQEPLGTLLSDWINALTTKPFACFRESVKTNFLLGDLSKICLTTRPPQGFCENERWNSGRKKAIFGFEGFGPCLGITQPTHPHLGEISQKKSFFYAFS